MALVCTRHPEMNAQFLTELFPFFPPEVVKLITEHFNKALKLYVRPLNDLHNEVKFEGNNMIRPGTPAFCRPLLTEPGYWPKDWTRAQFIHNTTFGFVYVTHQITHPLLHEY